MTVYEAPRACDLVVTPNDFEGTDTQRINKAIDAAIASGKSVVIPKINQTPDGPRDVWVLDSAIALKSDTTLELHNCHIKLSDRCRDNFMRSANCGIGITDIKPMQNIHIVGKGAPLLEGADHPRATGDSAKTLGERTYGTDAGIKGQSQTGDWRNIGILMAYVENFTIENLHIKDSHCWAISLERCAHGRARDLRFSSTETRIIDGKKETHLNQDGLDLRQGCHDITIENIWGHTGDDLIALTNIHHADITAGNLKSTMVSAVSNRGDGLDDIRNITIRNVRGFSKGGHQIVRLLNASGLKIHDIIIDGLIDTSQPGVDPSCFVALRIGDANPAWGGVNPLGDTCRIIASNIVSRAKHTVLIAGSLSESIISNVMKHGSGGDPICYQSGPKNVRNVQVNNVYNMDV